MKKKTIIFTIIYIIIATAFVAIPFSPADVFIRIDFNDIASDSCSLYYSIGTPFSYSEEQCIHASVDRELNQISFRLDGALAEQILDLRLDFANQEDLICINDISVSSAGIVKKEYHPCTFFASNNIALTNGSSVSVAEAVDLAYIATTDNDPYVIFTNELTRDIMSHASSYRLTRALICVFVGVALILMKKKVFTEH